MPPSLSLEARLAALSALRDDPSSPEAVRALRKALGAKSNHLAAKAAEIVREGQVVELIADMVDAFDRFMLDPIKTDKGCAAKAAIAEALYQLEYGRETLFLQGVRHRQLEPVYGGRADTAVELRGTCALALVRINYADVMNELAALLADPEPQARAAAARAIGYSERPDGVPLLRYKLLAPGTGSAGGDAPASGGREEPYVLTECMAALLGIDSQNSLAFVAGSLDSDDSSAAEAAAMALGESRRREALPVLQAWFDRTLDRPLRRTALLAIAMLRHDEAFQCLLAIIADDATPTARDAISALGTYRHDGGLRQRVEAAVSKRGERELDEAFGEAFGD